MERAAELMETLRVLGQACMTWWVSATLLCATILGISWSRRQDIGRAGRWATHALFGLVTVFFFSICSFGVVMIMGTARLGAALVDACTVPPPAVSVCLASDAQALTSTISVGIGIGTTSFILFALAWVGAWVLTIRGENGPGARPGPTS